MVPPLWRTVWRFLKNLKTEFPHESAIPLLGLYLEKTIIRKTHGGDFPGGPPPNAEDMDPIPAWGRFHRPQSK